MALDTIVILARLLLVGVFLVSGCAKAADLSGTRQAIVEFGIPLWLARPTAWILPLIEVAIAVMLLTTRLTWWGAVGAGGLLLLFMGGIVYNLNRGNRPDCHCFGQIHSEPIGRGTLIRNGVLLMIAAFLLWQGEEALMAQGGVLAWLGGVGRETFSVRNVLIACVGFVVVIALVVQSWIILHLFRQQGRLLLRIDALEQAGVGNVSGAHPGSISPAPPTGLRPGTAAPAFKLPDLSGRITTLDNMLAAGKPLLLLFADPGCGPCRALLPEVKQWQATYASSLDVVVISRGDRETNVDEIGSDGLIRVLLQEDYEVADAYGARGTPSAVLVQPNGRIGSLLAPGRDAIRALIAELAERRAGGGTTVPITRADPGHIPVTLAETG